MTGMFSTTVAAGIATRFRFNVIPPKDSEPKELYQLVTVFRESVFIFIFCCVINLLFYQIDIFYLENQILILKLPKETPLDFFGISTLSTVPTNHQIRQVISAILAKTHPSGCKRSRCGPDRIGGLSTVLVNSARLKKGTSQVARLFALPLTNLTS